MLRASCLILITFFASMPYIFRCSTVSCPTPGQFMWYTGDCVNCSGWISCPNCYHNGNMISSASCTTTVCVSGQYQDINGNCVDCNISNPFCIGCYEDFAGDANCLTCASGNFVNCVSSCTACTSPCGNCVTFPDSCTSCISNYYLSGASCIPCHAACNNCNAGTANDCSSCAAGYYWQPAPNTNLCANACPSGYFGNVDQTCTRNP